MVFPSSEDWMTSLRATIRTTFDITDEGVCTWILGMGVDFDSYGNITLQQHKYITDMLTEFNMTDSNPSLLPWSPGAELTFHDGDDAFGPDIPYSSLVGSLLWTAVCTRPDIAAAVSCLCRYVSRPKTCHWTPAKRVLRYLKGSSFSGIVFSHHSSPIECSAFVDSTWGSDPASVVSVSGQLVCLGPVGAPHTPSVGDAPTFWRFALQTVVAQSTCEAEYIVVASVSQEILFVRQLLTDLGLNLQGPTPVFCDNQSTIRNVTRGCTSRKTRHISLKYHLSRDLASKGIIRMVYVPIADNCADLLTKPVPLATFNHLRGKILNK
jgi:hypothetical protein